MREVDIDKRLSEALIKTLTPALINNTPQDFYAGKLHVFLTCRALSRALSKSALPKPTADLFEEVSLKSLIKSLASGRSEMWHLQMLFKELPAILTLDYPVVGDIKNACCQLLPQVMIQYRMQEKWQRYREYEYLLKMLQTIK